MQYVEREKSFFMNERNYSCSDYYRKIVESMHDYIYIVWIEDGKPIYTEHHPSCKAVTGYDSRDYLDDHELWYRMIADEHKETVLQQINNVIKDKKISSIEHKIKHKNGETRWVRNLLSPCIDENGSVIAYFGLVSDITDSKIAEEQIRQYYTSLEHKVQQRTAELRRAKEQAEAANRAKTMFLARVSHDLRTPLTGIVSLIEMIKDLLGQKNEITDILTFQTEMLLGLISDFHDLSQIEQGSFTLQSEYLHPKSLICSLVKFFSLLTHKKGIELSYEIANNVADAYLADSKRIKQLLMNLLSNAVKYTEKGFIELKLEVLEDNERDSLLKFSVIDTGIGIASEKLEDIFKPYFQAHTGYKTSKDGVGLGLSICKHLADLMSGYISVISQPHQGSTFSFVVRLNKATDVECDEHIDETACIAFDRKYRILVVEDDLINCEIIKSILTDNNYIVDNAINGKDALHKFFNSKYDLILMDLNMPIMDGYEASNIIRQHEKYNNLKETVIIAFTASDLIEVTEKIEKFGLNDVIMKPVSKKSLLKKIKEWLKK